MKSTAKSQTLVRDVADKLNKRLANGAGINGSRQAFDANGWPMLFLSHNANEAEAQSVIVVRISAVDAVSKDIFGNSLTAFAPHILEVAYEKDAGGKPIPAQADLQTVLFETIKTGCRMQVKEIANATAVSEASMNAATANLDIEELYWPTKGV